MLNGIHLFYFVVIISVVDKWDMMTDWMTIPAAPLATPAQRKALYRLGMAPSVVRRLTVQQADTYLKAALAARQAAGPTATAK